jgi:hypothetical protein
MTNDEVKKAWLARIPVCCDGINYFCVSALIYRLTENGEMILSVELMDKNGHSITIARPEKVEVTNVGENTGKVTA